jgi:hypothetical protein
LTISKEFHRIPKNSKRLPKEFPQCSQKYSPKNPEILKISNSYTALRGRKPFRPFYTCILPNFVVHDITKEIFKNSHFEDIARNSAINKVWELENNTYLN